MLMLDQYPENFKELLSAAKKLKQIANTGGYHFVDLTSPMPKINKELQKDDFKEKQLL